MDTWLLQQKDRKLKKIDCNFVGSCVWIQYNMKTFEHITLAELCNFFRESMHQKMGIPTFTFNFFVSKAKEQGWFMSLLWHAVGVYICTLDWYFAAIVMTLYDL